MNIHEYQAKEVLRGFGVPVPRGKPAFSVEEAVTAMKEGAFDFIQKPVDLDHLKLLLDRATKQQELLRENLLLREEYAAHYGFPRIVAEHPTMKDASQMTQRVAQLRAANGGGDAKEIDAIAAAADRFAAQRRERQSGYPEPLRGHCSVGADPPDRLSSLCFRGLTQGHLRLS